MCLCYFEEVEVLGAQEKTLDVLFRFLDGDIRERHGERGDHPLVEGVSVAGGLVLSERHRELARGRYGLVLRWGRISF